MTRLAAHLTPLLVLGSILTFSAAVDAEPPERARRVVISTDVATGLIDSHGGRSLTPTSNVSVAPQDIDDGLAVAMALNLDAERRLDVSAIVPVFGNATLPPQMLVARKIVRDLKGRKDIPIGPGASEPGGQTLNPAPTFFDGSEVPIVGREGSFAAVCRNRGVELLQRSIDGGPAPVTILALGPLTDVACLLQTAPEQTLGRIDEIIALVSQVEGESLQINGKVVNDFNARMDPLATVLMLAADVPHIRIRLMTFGLTGQTSQTDGVIAFNAETYPGPPDPRPRNLASFRWLLDAAVPRNTFWSGIFGVPEGPFDQYTVVAAIEPKLFDCRDARAYVQQCPTPAWSPAYPPDDSEQPYNAPDNPCTDHGPDNGNPLNQVPAQLVVSLDPDEDGPLVRGKSGIDGNLPPLSQPARPVTACVDFASRSARREFEAILKAYTW